MLSDFQLSEDPFSIATDPRFLYFGGEQLEAIASLFHTVVEGRGFAALIAPPGMGKTTLLHYFQQRMTQQAHMVLLESSFDDSKEILQSILLALGSPPLYLAGYSEYWRRLRTLLVERYLRGQKVVLMFDEAQGLTIELLEGIRLLSNLETRQSKLLQIILSGQPLLDKKLQGLELEQLRQRISMFCRMHPLPRGEVGAYINHRLRVAGRVEELFTRGAAEAIARSSGCIPRNINRLCSTAMVLAWTRGRRIIDEQIAEDAASDLAPVAI